MTRNAVRLGDTYTALLYCAEWVKRTPDNMKAAFQMAELHRQSRNYSEAEVWYAKVIKADAEQFPVALYHIGDMQLSQGKVEEATKNFNLFKKVAKNVKDDSYKKLVANRLLSCAYVMAMKDSNRTALTANLGNTINGPHIEFSPIPMGDTALVYGALREDEVKYYDLETFDSLNIPMRKLYLAVKKGDTWEGAGELPGPFNDGCTYWQCHHERRW
jgi:tetratricopeptide (TPR) repeat protein